MLDYPPTLSTGRVAYSIGGNQHPSALNRKERSDAMISTTQIRFNIVLSRSIKLQADRETITSTNPSGMLT